MKSSEKYATNCCLKTAVGNLKFFLTLYGKTAVVRPVGAPEIFKHYITRVWMFKLKKKMNLEL